MFTFKFNNKEYEDKKLNESMFDILSKTELLSMSTICPDGMPHINTAFFSFDNDLNLYFISSPQTTHIKNAKLNNNVGVTVFNSSLKFWKDDMQGVQLFGNCHRTHLIELPKGITSFIKRFPVFESLVSSPEDFSKKSVEVKMYTIKTKKIKLFDEKRFGEEVFIELELR